MQPNFLIAAPSYTHMSAGIRALYRLCHHLNVAGYSASVTPFPGGRIDTLPDWITPLHEGSVGDSIVVYPEIVSGNPLNARKVVRWVLNNPGLLGGDNFYADDEMVFVFNPARLSIASRAVSKPLGPSRVLFLGLVDPAYIYPDATVAKTIDCCYTQKGRALRKRLQFANQPKLAPIEEITPTMASLGEVLRRTRTLYSYDHASNVLKEAAISGCQVLVLHEDGQLLDPETCGCAYNIHWEPGYREGYAQRFSDSSFIHDFIRELRTRWDLPASVAQGPRYW